MKNMKNNFVIILLLFLSTVLQAEQSSHDDYLGLFSQTDTSFIVGSGQDAIEIKRVMTPCGKNRGFLQPLIPTEGVTLISERDMLHALNDKEGMVVDMRLESHFYKETIPTAINIPYTDISIRMDEFGCQEKAEKWDCSKAKKVYAFCNGPACTQSPIGIRDMVRYGFPPEKIFYYRGGMLVWSAIGLNTVKGEF